MKSYLGLIPVSAKVHRRQNRMTIMCIVFAVFLVTAVFSMAEMGIRAETSRLVDKHGLQALITMATSSAAQNYFAIAAVLFALVLLAGVLMISSSIGSCVAQRTRFFGMMRCIGMSKKQVVRFVRLEALNWCKTAVPIGVALGIVSTWGLCAVLHFLVGEEFGAIPLFGISLIGIVSGIAVGIVTVLLAAGAPARRAAKVPPAAAVSGNAETSFAAKPAPKNQLFKIETALGIHHAAERKKNLILMTGSFALSIVLLFSFIALVELVNCMMPQSANTPDITISSADSGNSLDYKLPERIEGLTGVTRVSGRRSALNYPADVQAEGFRADAVDLISFGRFDLDCLVKDKMLEKGSRIDSVYGDSGAVLLIADESFPLTVGDSVRVGESSLVIAGRLKYNPFSANGSADGAITLIASDETFAGLTGMKGYSLVLVQTDPKAVDGEIEAIRMTAGEDTVFNDLRGQGTGKTYIAFVVCLYTFLGVIALIGILNIVNSISMSVTARTKQYGVMRAVGTSNRQITRMIAAEALTYTISGSAVGCAAGLTVSKLIYASVITTHYPYMVWRIPVLPLAVIVLLALLATAAAVYAPARRIRNMSVTETISEL